MRQELRCQPASRLTSSRYSAWTSERLKASLRACYTIMRMEQHEVARLGAVAGCSCSSRSRSRTRRRDCRRRSADARHAQRRAFRAALLLFRHFLAQQRSVNCRARAGDAGPIRVGSRRAWPVPMSPESKDAVWRRPGRIRFSNISQTAEHPSLSGIRS